jgi:hypothetical protein
MRVDPERGRSVNRVERDARVAELWSIVDKAEKELARLGSSRSLTKDVEAAMAELDAGDDPVSQGKELGNMLAAGLNLLAMQGEAVVTAHSSDDVAIGTDFGDLRYDGDEWYFLERP